MYQDICPPSFLYPCAPESPHPKIITLVNINVWWQGKIYNSKRSVPLRRFWTEFSDMVPIIILWVIKGINSILQKETEYSMKEKQTLKNPTLKQNAINTFYNLYYDYWDLIRE